MTKKSNPAAKVKAEKPTITPEELSSRFNALLEEAEKFCLTVGLHADLMLRIFDAENDWTFILKIDALLEMAVREVYHEEVGLVLYYWWYAGICSIIPWLHQVGWTTVEVNGIGYILISVRFFAYLGTPLYLVVSGQLKTTPKPLGVYPY
jgi:hypothetical protein